MAFRGRKLRRLGKVLRRPGRRGGRQTIIGTTTGVHPGINPQRSPVSTAVMHPPPAHTRADSLSKLALAELPYFRNQPWFAAYAAKHGIK